MPKLFCVSSLVLRFAAFFHATYLKYQPPMRKFFNKDMEQFQHLSESEADELRGEFKNALQIVKSLFGVNAFKRFYGGDSENPNGAWEGKKFNASLYDVMMGVLCDKPKNQVYAALDLVREAFIDLMVSNKEFIDAILLGTSAQKRVRKRFDLARSAIDEVLKHHKPQPRCFTLNLKKELFAANATCAICDQHIHQIDDSAVDHIRQYWQGGKTIPENADIAIVRGHVVISRQPRGACSTLAAMTKVKAVGILTGEDTWLFGGPQSFWPRGINVHVRASIV